MINDLYKRYPNGFYVHAETKMDSAKKAAEYIGRHLARPAIVEYRIIKYDGQVVKFWYEDHTTGEVVERFSAFFMTLY
ncbi:Putative transposase [Alkaliphilus peptidifermentans DSM 18978]|uniref:Putative transposase n=1 Tax=Alkaliphilus peptidifermentans DSM 18978 TaxID=1120976 RepID=A0A1G5AAP8_9FIRM|nr:Putative transposase [Alkaliphilus peptidifermentans DSM 18978]